MPTPSVTENQLHCERWRAPVQTDLVSGHAVAHPPGGGEQEEESEGHEHGHLDRSEGPEAMRRLVDLEVVGATTDLIDASLRDRRWAHHLAALQSVAERVVDGSHTRPVATASAIVGIVTVTAYWLASTWNGGMVGAAFNVVIHVAGIAGTFVATLVAPVHEWMTAHI